MATSFSWNIKNMEVRKSEGNLSDVVIVVYWDRDGSRTVSGKTYSASSAGVTIVGPPDPYSFTPFDQLTEQQVVGWVESSLGQEQLAVIDARIDKEIAGQAAPQQEVLPPPWQ